MLLDAMIAATTDDLNGIEFVSRDVERMTKKGTGSDSWIDRGMKRWNGRARVRDELHRGPAHRSSYPAHAG
jgi:hypothetical protein